MGLKADIEPGQSLIVGNAVVRCEYKKGGRTRLDIIAPDTTRIVVRPTDVEIEHTVDASKRDRP